MKKTIIVTCVLTLGYFMYFIPVSIVQAQEASESICPCDFDLEMVQEIVSSMDEYNVECTSISTQKMDGFTLRHIFELFPSGPGKGNMHGVPGWGLYETPTEGPVITWTTDYKHQSCNVAIIDDIDATTTSVTEITMDQLDACSDQIRIACDSFIN